MIGHQISATDKPLDNLVYELYGLTDEEIQVVEEATALSLTGILTFSRIFYYPACSKMVRYAA